MTLTTGVGIAAQAPGADAEVIRVHKALCELAAIEPRQAQVVYMRYFGGLEHAEIAEALGVRHRTVERDWERARSVRAEKAWVDRMATVFGAKKTLRLYGNHDAWPPAIEHRLIP